MTEYFFILFGTPLVRVSSWHLPKTGPKEVGIFTVPLTKALALVPRHCRAATHYF